MSIHIFQYEIYSVDRWIRMQYCRSTVGNSTKIHIGTTVVVFPLLCQNVVDNPLDAIVDFFHFSIYSE